jgi:filamentous hemagglutinin
MKGNENQTLQDLSHAVLGAALAVANNSSAVGGALAGGGGELAAQILTKELYPQAFDANGNLQRDKLTPEQANNVTALSSAIGALLSGATGGSMHDAAIGGLVATNAVENNYLDHRRPDSMRLSEKERYEAAVAGCESGDSNACKTRDDLAMQSKKRDYTLETACRSGSLAQCTFYAR